MYILKKVFIVSCLLSTLLFGSNNVDIKNDIPSFISANWFKDHLNDPKLVIIDVRKEELYKKGHLKGAINLPTFKKLFDEDLFMPKINVLKETFSEAGINNKSLVAIYDNGDFIWAARCYWLLEVLGHKNVGLLTDDYVALKHMNFPISKDVVKPKKTNFIPMIDKDMIETKLSTLLAVNKKTIIDGRPKEYYDGLKSSAKRFGHIKSALNYPGSGNSRKTAKGNHILKLDKLKELYKDLDKSKPIILYCMDGADAAMNYIVLKKLGYKVSVYEGGWIEWGNDESLPMETSIKK